jgi:hypothetical protein
MKLTKRFPHVEAQSVVPAMSTLPTLLRSIASGKQTLNQKERKHE